MFLVTMPFMDVCVCPFQFLCLCVYQYMFEIMCCVSSYLSLFVMRRFKRDGLHCCYILTVSSVFCFSFTLPLHGEKNNHIFTGPKLPRTMQASRGQSGTDTVFRESIWDSVQFTNSSIQCVIVSVSVCFVLCFLYGAWYMGDFVNESIMVAASSARPQIYFQIIIPALLRDSILLHFFLYKQPEKDLSLKSCLNFSRFLRSKLLKLP